MSTRRLTTVSCDTPIEQVVEIIRRDGAVAICNFVSEETLEVSYRGPGQLSGRYPCGMDPYFAGTQTRRTARILAKKRLRRGSGTEPLFLETAKQVLQTPTHVWVGNDRVEITPDIQLSMTQAIQIGPGQGLQPLHRDDATSLWRHPRVWSRGSLAAHAGDYRLHRRERRDAGHSWQSSMG
ncbi:phytanoyl-CoA dioxygenase family protein [Pseudomonas aeruginosa]|nr:phytanoyl-CoA dioxygenase family protein [Pseudomonas aeruginosa]